MIYSGAEFLNANLRGGLGRDLLAGFADAGADPAAGKLAVGAFALVMGLAAPAVGSSVWMDSHATSSATAEEASRRVSADRVKLMAAGGGAIAAGALGAIALRGRVPHAGLAGAVLITAGLSTLGTAALTKSSVEHFEAKGIGSPERKAYDAARAKVDELRGQEGPQGLVEHVLPHETDPTTFKLIKYGVGTAGAIGIGAAALAGAGRLSGSAALQAAGVNTGRAAGGVGILTGVVAFGSAMTGMGMGSPPASDAVSKQGAVVRERYEALKQAYPDA